MAAALLALLAGGTPAGAQSSPAGAPAAPPPKVTVYGSFDRARIAPVLSGVVRDTGIDVALVSDDDDLLLGRLLREGPASPADILLLRNAARFERAAAAGLLQPLKLASVEQAVPARLRDPEARWFAIATFARVLVYAADRVKPGELTSYDSPTNPTWRGRLCLPPQHHPGFRSLLAGVIRHNGPDYAEAWARGMLANAAPLDSAPPAQRTPEWIDRALIAGLDAKVCDITLLDSRTLTRLTDPANRADRRELDKIGAVWPNQAGSGTQVDVLGAAMTAASTQRESVQKVFDYLMTDAAQRAIADALYAYPVKAGVPLTDALTRWGPFKPDETPLAELIAHLPQARALGDKIGWP